MLSNYNINVESEALKVMGNTINRDSVMDILNFNLSSRFNFTMVLPLPNLITVLSQQFKIWKMQYPADAEELDSEYDYLLDMIADRLKNEFMVNFAIPEDNKESYLTVYYDFFVSNFKQYVITFFTNYICKFRNDIYKEMHLSEYKSKNSSVKYGKTMYDNPKYIAITSMLEVIMNNMCAFDIPLSTILENIYSDQSVISIMNDSVQPVVDFFHQYYATLIQNPYCRQSIISSVRLGIHNYAVN